MKRIINDLTSNNNDMPTALLSELGGKDGSVYVGGRYADGSKHGLAFVGDVYLSIYADDAMLVYEMSEENTAVSITCDYFCGEDNVYLFDSLDNLILWVLSERLVVR